MVPTSFKLEFTDATTVNFTAIAFSMNSISCTVSTKSPVYQLAVKAPEIYKDGVYTYTIDIVNIKSLSIK